MCCYVCAPLLSLPKLMGPLDTVRSDAPSLLGDSSSMDGRAQGPGNSIVHMLLDVPLNPWEIANISKSKMHLIPLTDRTVWLSPTGFY